MTHLTHDELRRWRDAPAPEERERVVRHLAQCDACCRSYAELARTRPADAAPTLDPADFIRRGYRVRRAAARSSSWTASWFKPAAAVAAASLVIALAVWTTPPESEDVVTRGAAEGVTLLNPRNDVEVDASVRFEWRTATGSACHLRMYDPSRPETPVIDRPAISGARLTDADENRFVSGVIYRWFVECRSPRGDTVSSPAGRFRWR